MAQAVPVAVRVGLAVIRQVGLVLVPHIEQIAEEPDAVTLDAISQQGSGRHPQVFAQQIEQRCLNGCHHMDTGAQIKGLLSADVVLDMGSQPIIDRLQGVFVCTNAAALHKGLDVLQGLGDLFTARDLAHAGGTGGIGQNDDIAGKVRGVCTGEVELHAVTAGNGIDFHFGNYGCHFGPLLCFCMGSAHVQHSFLLPSISGRGMPGNPQCRPISCGHLVPFARYCTDYFIFISYRFTFESRQHITGKGPRPVGIVGLSGREAIL